MNTGNFDEMAKAAGQQIRSVQRTGMILAMVVIAVGISFGGVLLYLLGRWLKA